MTLRQATAMAAGFVVAAAFVLGAINLPYLEAGLAGAAVAFFVLRGWPR